MNRETNLFDLNLDGQTKYHLSEASRWAKVVAVTGYISVALMIGFLILLAATDGNLSGEPAPNTYEENPDDRIYGIITAIFFSILLILHYLLPCYFSMKFANKINNALRANDSALLTSAFRTLKIIYRYIGILSIICLALFLLVLLSVLVSN